MLIICRCKTAIYYWS